jgi:hypothetical protein
MNEPMPKDLQKWEVTRQMGKIRFILQTGVLAWGIPMFVVMTFFVNRQPDRPLTPNLIAISAVIWALGGACFGWMIWLLSERKYQKHLASRKPTEI